MSHTAGNPTVLRFPVGMALLLLHTLAREYEMDALELLKHDHAKVKEL
jgi:hypothetical protein